MLDEVDALIEEKTRLEIRLDKINKTLNRLINEGSNR